MIRERVKDIQLSIRKISKKAEEQEDCIRLDIGQPSFDTPEHVKKVAREEMDRFQGYTADRGIDELRDAVAREESGKKGIEAEQENIMISAGGMEALYSVFATVLDPEDKAVFNDPCWGPYKLISEVNGNRWSQVDFFENGELTDEARKEIRDAELVLVNTPNNPTGKVLEKEEAKEIAEVAEDSDTLLVSDEVYHRLTYGEEHVSPARFTDESVIIGSMSKNHAMTGWRVGWVNSSPDYVDNFSKASRGMVACPPAISQFAAVEALKNDSHVEKMRGEYGERRDILVQKMNELGWEFVEPEGAIYAFPDIGRDSWDFALEMVEKGVSIVPGEPFGPGSDENVRICFGSVEQRDIEKAFDVLEDEV